MFRIRNTGWVLSVLAWLALATSAPLWAADTTNYPWTKSGSATYSWSDAANWSAVPPNGGGSFAVLRFGPGGNNANVVASNNFSITPFLLNSLVFTNVGTAYTLMLAGGDLQFVDTVGTVPPTITQDAALGATVNNALALAGNVTAGGVGTGTITLGGAISGAGSLTKNGRYQLTLNKAGTFAGGTYLNAGTLSLGNNQALGYGSLTVSGGVLQASTAVALTNDVIVTGDFTVRGAANLSLVNIAFDSPYTLTNLNSATTVIVGTNSGAGAVFARSGNLILSNAVNTSDLFLRACGGGITLVGGGTLGTAFGTPDTNVVAGTPGTITLNPLTAGITTFNLGDITNGPAAMGTLAVNTGIAGSTNIVNVGTLSRIGRSSLVIAPQNSLGVREQVSVAGGVDLINGILPPWVVSSAAGGEFLTSNATWLTNATYTVVWSAANGTNGSTPSASDIVKVRAATMLTNDISAYALNVQAGRLNLNGNSLALGGGDYGGLILTNTTSISNGVVVLNGAETLAYVGSGTGTLGANLSGSGSLTKFGAGTLALTNFATLYTGDTLIDAGTLSFSPAQDYVYTNNINGAGILAKNGPSVFTVANSSGTLGGVTVSKGTLAFSGGTRTEQFPPVISGGATLLLNSGVRYDNSMTNLTFNIGGALVTDGSTNTITFAAAAGSVSVNSGGVLAVGPTSVLAIANGGLTVNSGTLSIGSLDGPGTLFATNATLTFGGNGSIVTVTNGTLFAKGMNLAAANTVKLTILQQGIIDLRGGVVPQASGSDNSIFIDGGVLTNMVNQLPPASWPAIRLAGGTRSALTLVNGGRLFTPPGTTIMVGGNGGSGSCSLNIGGSGLVSVARVGGITVCGGNDTGAAGTSLNRMTVSNGLLYSEATSIGWDNDNGANGANTRFSNSVAIASGGYWNVGGGSISIGRGNAASAPRFDNWLTVDAGVVTNVATLAVGVQNTWGNAATIFNGGQLYATGVSIGPSSLSNTVRVTSGGLLEAGRSLTVGSSAGNAFTCAGGILQFTTNAPTITRGNGATVDGGTISFRGIVNANVNGNLAGSQLTNLTFSGNNGFRLCCATNVASTNQTYVFDPGLGAANYTRLEMVNGTTRYRGQAGNSLTIGVSVGSGGEMLCSNTAAFVDLVFTNNGTLTLVNSTLTFATDAVMNGTVVIDLDRLGSPTGVLLANNLTLGGSSTLMVTGTASNQTLGVVSGALAGEFGTIQGLPSKYSISYRDGQVSIKLAPKGSVIFLR